ncbi:MAG: hypothetical protein AAGB05_18040 [Pseudomonadota bacterium]
MVLGYLLLGWIGGATVALIHLTLHGGTWGAAVALFFATALGCVLGLACLTAVRMSQRERAARHDTLQAPVYAMPLPARMKQSRRGPLPPARPGA